MLHEQSKTVICKKYGDKDSRPGKEMKWTVVREDSLVFTAEVWFPSLWLAVADNSVPHTKANTRDFFIRIHPWIFYLTTFSFCSLEEGLKEPFQNWLWNNVFKTCWILYLFQPFILYHWESSHSALISRELSLVSRPHLCHPYPWVYSVSPL